MERRPELIDYLGGTRARVTYEFDGQDVLIVFHHMDAQAAQALLDGWCAEPPHALDADEHHTVSRCDLWSVGHSH